VQIALVHQVGSNATSYPFLKQHVVRQNHGRSPARLQGSINVLQKIELRVAGFEGEVISRRSTAASLGAERISYPQTANPPLATIGSHSDDSLTVFFGTPALASSGSEYRLRSEGIWQDEIF